VRAAIKLKLHDFVADIGYLLFILKKILSYLRKQRKTNFRFLLIETHDPLGETQTKNFFENLGIHK
jgi:hypothetical protein